MAREERSAGRPPDPRKVEAIVEASWALFLRHGVEAASMEAIAARAGVAKVTLYKHFPDKAALFEAGVLREMEKIEAAQSRGALPEADLEATLRAFGLGIMGFIASDPAVEFYGALSGELRRRPDLARRFYAVGPGRTRANLVRLLAAAASAGELALDDPEEAAEHLFGLWQGFSNFQLSLGVGDEGLREGLARRVERAVAAFLKAYAPRGR